jgi:hypothetical protein
MRTNALNDDFSSLNIMNVNPFQHCAFGKMSFVAVDDFHSFYLFFFVALVVWTFELIARRSSGRQYTSSSILGPNTLPIVKCYRNELLLFLCRHSNFQRDDDYWTVGYFRLDVV